MDSPESALRDANRLESTGDLSAAEAVLDRACRNWRGEPEFKLRHASLLLRLGRPKRALRRYRQVMKSHPQRLLAVEGAAMAAYRMGRHRLAERLYVRAMAIGMDGDRAALGIATCLVARGEREQGWQTALSRFETSGNSHAGLHGLLSGIASELGRTTPPLEAYDSPIQSESTPAASTQMTAAVEPERYSGSRTMEEMAGIAATDIISPQGDDPMALLSSETEEKRRRTVEVDTTELRHLTEQPAAEVSDDVLGFEL